VHCYSTTPPIGQRMSKNGKRFFEFVRCYSPNLPIGEVDLIIIDYTAIGFDTYTYHTILSYGMIRVSYR